VSRLQIGGQIIKELEQLITICQKLKVTSYLEVGARDGGALEYFVTRVRTINKVCTVDWVGQRWGRANSDIQLNVVMESLEASGLDTYTIYGNSTTPEIIAEAQSYGPYDVVFIDADHTYDGVKADLKNYGPMATIVIGMHDINHPANSPAFGPTLLFKEERDNYRKSETFIAEGSKKGIGVLYK